jgi:hypothetical protein
MICSSFKGPVATLSQSLGTIPSILQVTLFLRVLHARYNDLLTQFGSKQKDLASTTINSVMADAWFMDTFTLVDSQSKPSAPGPCTPATQSVATNKDGKEFCTAWEWLGSYDSPGILARWLKSLTGGFYCAFSHSSNKHHPTKCPMLVYLGVKLIVVGGGGSSSQCNTPGGPAAGGTPAGSKNPPATPFAAPAKRSHLRHLVPRQLLQV